MRAVWSLWSKPSAGHRHATSHFHYALLWSLSILEASEHYPDTWLYTDDDGARLLIDALQLPFTHVRTDLNVLASYDSDLWALGKIYTYRLQDEHFVHIDHDCFLWLPLPENLVHSDVFAQNPEPFTVGGPFYEPEKVEQALARVNGWLPDEWTWFRASHTFLRGECCGIYGGARLDFIHYVADLAFTLLEHPANRGALADLNDKGQFITLLEQFLPSACLEYHRWRADSPFRDLSISYLFSSMADLFNPEHAARTGFTHLLHDTKKNFRTLKLLEKRLRLIDPAQYERCRRIEEWHLGW